MLGIVYNSIHQGRAEEDKFKRGVSAGGRLEKEGGSTHDLFQGCLVNHMDKERLDRWLV